MERMKELVTCLIGMVAIQTIVLVADIMLHIWSLFR